MKQKIAEFINVIFGFRKFILMLLVYSIAVIFRLKNLVSGAELVDLLKATTLGFLGANGVEHIVGAVKEFAAKGDDPGAANDDLVTKEQELADAKAEDKNG
jgi:hypothetical protein